MMVRAHVSVCVCDSPLLLLFGIAYAASFQWELAAIGVIEEDLDNSYPYNKGVYR